MDPAYGTATARALVEAGEFARTSWGWFRKWRYSKSQLRSLGTAMWWRTRIGSIFEGTHDNPRRGHFCRSRFTVRTIGLTRG